MFNSLTSTSHRVDSELDRLAAGMGCQGGEEGDNASILGRTVQARPHPTRVRNQGPAQPCHTHRPQVQLNLASKVAKVYAHAELQLKKPQSRKLPCMEASDDTPSRSGNLLTTVASALVAKPASASAASAATAAAMAATETEAAEAAELVQARSPHPCRATPHSHACGRTPRAACPSHAFL